MKKAIIRDILIGIGIAIALVTGGCGNLTVASKPVTAHSIAWDENVQNAGIIDCNVGCLVTPNWMAKYGDMEREFTRSIAADSNIKKEGANYRVSYEVVNHFIEMKSAKRGGP